MGIAGDIEYIITEPKISDAQNLLRFLKIVGGETDNLTFGSDGVNLSLKEEENLISNYLTKKEGAFLIAKIGDDIIASSGAFLYKDRPRLRHILDFGIAIKKDHCGKGLGSKLMDKVLEISKDRGYKRIQLSVRSDNIRAINLYLKKGFAIEGKFRQSLKINSYYHDEYIMGKIL